jgi:hypothetical protein
VQLNKKGARVAATIRDHTEDRSRCTVDLEIEDPIHPGQVIRQAYPKAVQLYQLTRREEYSRTEASDGLPEPAPASTTATPTIPTTHVRLPAEESIQPTDQAAPGDLGDPSEWTFYSRADLRSHDAARRAWLRAFAQGRKFPAFWFTMHGSRSSYYRPGAT